MSLTINAARRHGLQAARRGAHVARREVARRHLASLPPLARLHLGCGTIERIYSEHVFEHLELDDAVRLMRDCRRALSRSGVMRIAMPDLENLVDHYRGDWHDQAWLRGGDYPHITSGAQMLNVALREWGHRYVYDYDELRARLLDAGFSEVVRQQWGESAHEDLRGLETRPDSLLVVEVHG